MVISYTQEAQAPHTNTDKHGMYKFKECLTFLCQMDYPLHLAVSKIGKTGLSNRFPTFDKKRDCRDISYDLSNPNKDIYI